MNTNKADFLVFLISSLVMLSNSGYFVYAVGSISLLYFAGRYIEERQ